MSKLVNFARDGEIATVILNRPESFNSFDLETIKEFADALVSIASDNEVRGVVISGLGKAFCAGGDLKWMIGSGKSPSNNIHELAGHFHRAVVEIRRMPKPVIAAINGVAAGGGFSLALAGDLRVMAESAVLRLAYISNGLCPDGGATFTLPRLVGLARAMEITAFDQPITAQQALAWGLATKVVPDGTAVTEALNMAHELAKMSLHAFGLAKQLLNDSWDTSMETQLERERAGIARCGAHPEGREGLKAFAEKRKPVFF